MKNFIGKSVTTKVPFMDGELDVKRLSVSETLDLQADSKAIDPESPEAEKEQLLLIVKVIRAAVADAAELSDEQIQSFPIEELTRVADTALGNKSSEKVGNAA